MCGCFLQGNALNTLNKFPPAAGPFYQKKKGWKGGLRLNGASGLLLLFLNFFCLSMFQAQYGMVWYVRVGYGRSQKLNRSTLIIIFLFAYVIFRVCAKRRPKQIK